MPASDPQRQKVQTTIDRLDAIKREIVATKEGGAITGEERIREHTDHLYSALLSWEGKPAKYLLERTEALRHELRDVEAEFAQLAPQIHAMNLRPEAVPSSAPQNASACMHGEWDRCDRPADREAR